MLPIIIFFCLFGWTVAKTEISYVKKDGAVFLQAGDSNYALSHPKLRDIGWSIITVNEDHAWIHDINDEFSVQQFSDLRPAEVDVVTRLREDMLEVAKHDLIRMALKKSLKALLITHDSDSESTNQYKLGHERASQETEVEFFDGSSIHKGCTIKSPQLLKNTARMFVEDNLLSYVYYDGKVLMKHRARANRAELDNLSLLIGDFFRKNHASKPALPSTSIRINVYGDETTSPPESLEAPQISPEISSGDKNVATSSLDSGEMDNGLTATQTKITHVKADNAILVEAGNDHYALYEPGLGVFNNWATLSVNGERLLFHDKDCKTSTQQLSDLTKEQLDAITNLRAKLKKVADADLHHNDSGIENSPTHRYPLAMAAPTKPRFEYYEKDEYYTVTGIMPQNIARIFAGSGTLTFVYHDGKVLMKPAACVSQSETDLLTTLKSGFHWGQRRPIN